MYSNNVLNKLSLMPNYFICVNLHVLSNIILHYIERNRPHIKNQEENINWNS